MKNTWISGLAVLGMVVSPAAALELPARAKMVTDADAIEIFVGNRLQLSIFNTHTGKQVGSGTLHHRDGGVKAVNIVVDGKPIKRNLKWKIKGGKLCAGSIAAGGKTVCGTQGQLYRLGGMCYNSRDGKMVGTAFKC